MRVASLLLENFCRFRGRHEIPFTSGVNGIFAESDGDQTKSNGSGKTSLIRAVRFALFGAPSPKQLVSWGEDSMLVELRMDDGSWYRRGVKAGVGFAEANGAEDSGSSGVDRLVLERTGFDEQAFDSTCSLLGGDLGKFALTGQAERRDMLAAWVVPEVWTNAAEKVGPLVREAGAEVERLRGKLATLQSEQSSSELEAALSQLKEQIAKLPPPRVIDLAVVKEASERFRAWREYGRARLRLLFILEELEKDYPDLPDGTALISARSLLERGRDRLDQLERLCRGEFDGGCPVDKASCPRADEIRADKAKHALARTQGATWVAEKGREYHALQTQEDAHQRALKQRERLLVEAEQLFLVPPPAPIRMQDREALKEHSSPQIADERTTFERQRGALTAKLERAYEAEHYASQTQVALQAANAKKLQLDWLARAVGRNGVPAMLVDHAAGSIAADAATMLEAAGSDLRVAVRLSTTLSRLADRCDCGAVFATRNRNCSQCGAKRGNATAPDLSFVVWRGEETPVELAQRSTGERAMVAIAIRLAAVGARKRSFGAQLSVLVLDEADANLDAENAEALHSLVKTCAAHVGVDQVLMTSHRPDFRLAADNLVRVIRSETGSSVCQ